MKKLRKSWKLIALFVFGAIVGLFYVGRPRASAHPAEVGHLGVELNYGVVGLGIDQYTLMAIPNPSLHRIDWEIVVRDATTGTPLFSQPMHGSVDSGKAAVVRFATPVKTFIPPLGSAPKVGRGEIAATVTLAGLSPLDLVQFVCVAPPVLNIMNLGVTTDDHQSQSRPTGLIVAPALTPDEGLPPDVINCRGHGFEPR